MTGNLSSDQIQKLQSLGISVPTNTVPESNAPNLKSPFPQREKPEGSGISDLPSTPLIKPPTTSKSSVLPLISISGLSLLSVGGLLFFKTRTEAVISPSVPISQQQDTEIPTPTQVPKSIQHFLLTSQQYFSQALQLQNTQANQTQIIAALNQSLAAANNAIQDFPTDYRGYEQRGRIYQSLLDSKPDLITQTLSDFTMAAHFNPTSAELTHTVANLYAKKGDLADTLSYLTKTITLEPTKAQNFYDLAQLQQQAGLIADAASTYSQLLTILPDPTQKQQVQNQLTSLQQLLSKNKTTPSPLTSPAVGGSPTLIPTITTTGPTIQADSGQGLIIAAPATASAVIVTGQTQSNALSGDGTLIPNQVSFTLTNTNITSHSQILVSLTQGGKNQTLKVLSKSDGACTIGFDVPINENVQFKWWIIN